MFKGKAAAAEAEATALSSSDPSKAADKLRTSAGFADLAKGLESALPPTPDVKETRMLATNAAASAQAARKDYEAALEKAGGVETQAVAEKQKAAFVTEKKASKASSADMISFTPVPAMSATMPKEKGRIPPPLDMGTFVDPNAKGNEPQPDNTGVEVEEVPKPKGRRRKRGDGQGGGEGEGEGDGWNVKKR